MNGSFTRREFALLTGAGLAAPGQTRDFASSFADPPREARPSTYWVWLNGYTEADQLTRELEELSKAGFSAVYILEIAARGLPEVPAGPAYMDDESVKAFAHVAREAARLNLEVGVTNASSWNSGGAWVTPEHASKGLYYSRISIEGPRRFSDRLPFPRLPQGVPAKPDGSPAIFSDLAVLAVPETELLPGYDFLIDLAPGSHTVNRVVLHNAPSRYGAKDFVVFASAWGADAADFREILRGSLKPGAGPQEFRFAPVAAQYLKLRILSGHDPSGRIELVEFEGFSTEGRNVVTILLPDGRKTVGGLLRATAEAGLDREWRAENIYDGRLAGPIGSWAVEERLPPRVPAAGVLNLTDKLSSGGRLDWDVPPGRWSVYRFINANTGQKLLAPSPKSAGLIIDHFSAEAARMHTEYMLGRLHTQIPDFRASALKYFYACSYEVRGAIWTPKLPEEFRRRRGYDMTPYLPVLAGAVVENEEVSERFRIDYRRTVSDLFIENFYVASRQVANRHGLQLVAEAGGPGWPLHQVPVDSLRALGALDIPRGEFWTRDRGIWVVKETAAAAHIYGKRLVQMEAFTSSVHWQYGLRHLKPVADRALCEGTNHFVWHTMPHVPPRAGKPGWVYYAGTHVGPAETWWPLGKPFFDYLARCSWLLRQGLFVADVCYYYGERGFNFVQPRHVDPSLGFGFDYDVTNSDVLLNRMSVNNGRLVLPDGMSYEILVLPDHRDMDLEVLERIERLVRDGATVAGRKPTRATSLKDYPGCDEKVRALAGKLWGACDGERVRETGYGKGKIYWGVPLREILARRGVGPDFSFKSLKGEADLDFIHRRDGRRDIYFVRNRKDAWAEAECAFRVKGRAPELWDAVSGKIARPASFEPAGGGTRLNLVLPPYGSIFVVFRAPGKSPAASRPRPPAPRVLDLAGPWELSFPEGWGAPASVRLDRLGSWTEHSDPGIRYFSGIATYRRRFDLPSDLLAGGAPLYLDLGEVGDVARVTLNGKPAGIAWTAPFRVEITPAAKAGENLLEVEVANTWSNRLTGDAQGAAKKYTNTNVIWRKDMPLMPSGLLGPVRLLAGSVEGLPA